MKKLFLFIFCVLLSIMAKAQEGVIQTSDISAVRGNEFFLPVYINLTDEAMAFQFDVYLPEGVEIVRNGGKYNLASGELLSQSNHTLFCSKRKDSSYRILCYSATNSKFANKQGELVKLKLSVDGEMEPGTYPITISHTEIVLSAELDNTHLQEHESELSVKEVGDENNIGEIVVTNEVVSDRAYDITGRHVSRIRSGQIVIVNGRKVVYQSDGKK